jgi:hypothetical protein
VRWYVGRHYERGRPVITGIQLLGVIVSSWSRGGGLFWPRHTSPLTQRLKTSLSKPLHHQTFFPCLFSPSTCLFLFNPLFYLFYYSVAFYWNISWPVTSQSEWHFYILHQQPFFTRGTPYFVDETRGTPQNFASRKGGTKLHTTI